MKPLKNQSARPKKVTTEEMLLAKYEKACVLLKEIKDLADLRAKLATSLDDYDQPSRLRKACRTALEHLHEEMDRLESAAA